MKPKNIVGIFLATTIRRFAVAVKVPAHEGRSCRRSSPQMDLLQPSCVIPSIHALELFG